MADSKSLHNYTLSPGWTREEVDILKIALMKFGIGKWKKIQKSGCLPSKTISQMNLQTQRVLGQQSLAEFMGLHGPEIQRKNNFIINTGNNLTQLEKEKRLKLNKQKYGLELTYIKSLRLPKPVNNKKEVVLSIDQIFNAKSNFSVVEKLKHLEGLKISLEHKLYQIEKKRHIKEMRKLYKPLDQAIVLAKINGGQAYEYVETVDL
ncbi:UNKNOWN [Stylonychia lemnae]|uniref:Myb-like domain-containing protein n=1 Tax=Stylonychia lemnae TaxID=5949 RepID=A0A078AUT2_STYLE|nr:UNKNOWN [Stylonychia lemnae]|eukprot:CDW84997.1 UNKNOWN [Stylonychia lemnae]